MFAVKGIEGFPTAEKGEHQCINPIKIKYMAKPKRYDLLINTKIFFFHLFETGQNDNGVNCMKVSNINVIANVYF